MNTDKYQPASKEGTKFQQAQYWLEKGAGFEVNGNQTHAEMAFKKAVATEAEAFAAN